LTISNTSVDKALQIVGCFTSSDVDLSLAELHERMDLSKPSLHRLCTTLCNNGFLSKDTVTGRYRLGIKMLEVAGIYLSANKVYDSIWKILNQMMELSNETVSLYKHENDSRKCIMRIESKSPLRHSVTVGQALPLDQGAAGKVILAETDHELADIKMQGYAITYGEREAYLGAIATPIYDENGDLFGALSISGPVERIRNMNDKEITEQLKSHAKSLSTLVNYL